MGFKVGDVVLRNRVGFSKVANASIAKDAVGTVCKEVTPGSMYRVQFEDFPVCMGVYMDSIRLAPTGTQGPSCDDCRPT